MLSCQHPSKTSEPRTFPRVFRHFCFFRIAQTNTLKRAQSLIDKQSSLGLIALYRVSRVAYKLVGRFQGGFSFGLKAYSRFLASQRGITRELLPKQRHIKLPRGPRRGHREERFPFLEDRVQCPLLSCC